MAHAQSTGINILRGVSELKNLYKKVSILKKYTEDPIAILPVVTSTGTWNSNSILGYSRGTWANAPTLEPMI